MSEWVTGRAFRVDGGLGDRITPLYVHGSHSRGPWLTR